MPAGDAMSLGAGGSAPEQPAGEPPASEPPASEHETNEHETGEQATTGYRATSGSDSPEATDENGEASVRAHLDVPGWFVVAADNGWARDGVPAEYSPWAQPPGTVRFTPATVVRAPDPEPPTAEPVASEDLPVGAEWVAADAALPEWIERLAPDATGNERDLPARRTGRESATGTRIAVISGDVRIGGLVAKLLADALDHEHRADALVLDAGADLGAPAWHTAVNEADQVILAVDAVGGGPATAARMLERTGMRDAMAVVMLPPARRGLSRGHEDIGAIRAHFEGRTTSVLFVPNDPQPTIASLAAWRRIIDELA